jgi:putative Mg2+ transporter-C (MgtC) family protein
MTELTTLEMLARLGVALGCGVFIGVERQWRQRSAGLRTYALVALGAALFVVMAALTPGEVSPTRVAAQVVAGVGFLGAGVIMRTGLNVQGLNTAGTIWCSAAVGTLAGSGMFTPAAVGTGGVLIINLLLRPVAQVINRRPVDQSEQPVRYCLKISCAEDHESQVRSLLVQLLSTSSLMLHALEHTSNPLDPEKAIVEASVLSSDRQDAAMEQIVSRIGLEPSILGISWRISDEPYSPNQSTLNYES